MSRARSSIASRGTDGFTLIEMLVGLLIIALATGLVGFALSGRQTETSAAQFAGQVNQMLAQAHQDALVSTATRTVDFDLEARTIRYGHRDQERPIPDGLELSVLVGLELVTLDGQVPILFFGEGGSTGAEITIAGGQLPIRLYTSWLTGLTRELADD